MQDNLYSIKQVSKKLNVSTSTVRRQIKEGLLKSVRVGNSIRISEEEVDKYLKIPNGGDSTVKISKETTPVKPLVKESKGLDIPRSKHVKYIIPGLSSIEAETLEALLGDAIEAEEIFSFLQEENYEKLHRMLSKIVKENNLSIKQSLILLFIEEEIYNLQTKKQLLLDLTYNENALVLLPLPPHLFLNFLEFLREGQIINTDHIIPPHMEEFKELIIDIDVIDPIELHEKFQKVEIIIIDGIKTRGGVMIRRNVASLITQYINNIKRIYFHNIPHLPKDQNFALISDKNFLAKIIDL
ncbi:MAG: helix-turn-helix domain-containing protein [Candidatus Daviesbacteria bacterium]|nr:helix-turn-helix domain-containing protein [Candidatus Daviesbacteria bacterium]